MPIPKPKEAENKSEFIERCMRNNTMQREFPKQEQRAAVCNSQWGSKTQNNIDMNKLKSIQVNNYEIKEAVHNGREYFVVPVVMMVEGVHNGSHGPIYHSVEVLSSYVQAWNGIPIMINHPEDQNGNYISANSPDQLQRSVGKIFNARFENNRLMAEAWLDKQKLLAVSEEASQHIQQHRPIDVSIGAFTEEIMEAGEWKGESYTAIAQGYRPDHLAILPGGVGACSWADGCGIRLNTKNKGGKMYEEISKNAKLLNSQGYTINPIVNAQGYRELIDKMRTKLNALDSEERMYFVQEVYDDHLIYQVVRPDNSQTLYRQDYTVNDSDEIEFSGEPTEVRRQVEYVTMSGMRRTKFNNNSKTKNVMVDKEKTPCGNCMEKIVELINNKQTRFEKSDREWLLTQDESTLDKLFPKDPEPVKVNQEQAIEVLSETFADMDKVMELLPADVKSKIELGLSAYNKQRNNLIKEIQANTDKDTWVEDDLKDMDIEVLQKIHKSVQPKGDYSGQGGSVTANDESNNPDDLLLPMGVTFSK